VSDFGNDATFANASGKPAGVICCFVLLRVKTIKRNCLITVIHATDLSNWKIANTSSLFNILMSGWTGKAIMARKKLVWSSRSAPDVKQLFVVQDDTAVLWISSCS